MGLAAGQCYFPTSASVGGTQHCKPKACTALPKLSLKSCPTNCPLIRRSVQVVLPPMPAKKNQYFKLYIPYIYIIKKRYIVVVLLLLSSVVVCYFRNIDESIKII